MSYENIPLAVNEQDQRFEVSVDGKKGFINFERSGNTLNLIHTEVDPDLEGEGVASALVKKTLTYIDENGLKMIPTCGYIRKYLQKHPEWQRLAVTNNS